MWGVEGIEKQGRLEAIDKLIADIQADTKPPKVQTIAEFIRNPAKP